MTADNIVESVVRDQAMCNVAWRLVVSTGPTFKLKTGEEIPMPAGETLPTPHGSEDWNDRYALYIAKHLGNRIAGDVAREMERMVAEALSRVRR